MAAPVEVPHKEGVGLHMKGALAGLALWGAGSPGLATPRCGSTENTENQRRD